MLLERLGILIAGKWIAGVSISEAIAESKRINSIGERVILNYLGEELESRKAISKNVAVYKELISRMNSEHINGSLSVKPTQLGLAISRGLFAKNYLAVVAHASRLGIFVWLDMEDYKYIEDTIRAYLKVHMKHKNAGICIQARTRRSLDDVKAIAKAGGIIRLVKGAYGTVEHLTYTKGEDVDRNYIRCMKYLAMRRKRFMVATHDTYIIGRALRLKQKYAIKDKRIEFAMLKGIRSSLAAQLAGQGDIMNIYVPFGEEWFSYAMRRLREEGHLILLLRSIFQS